MPLKRLKVRFNSPEVEAVRFQVVRYRRPKDAATNANQQENHSRIKEAARFRVLETVEATLDPATQYWLANVNIPRQPPNARFYKSLLRAEGFAITRDTTGKEVGRRSISIITAPPHKT
jgi:hypothetical protein